MDEFIDELLREERACDVILPRIQVSIYARKMFKMFKAISSPRVGICYFGMKDIL